MASVPEVESEISLTTDLQEVSLAAGNSGFYPVFFFKKVSCQCKSTCQRKGRCPCKGSSKPCTSRCSCGAGPSKPCKNKVRQYTIFSPPTLSHSIAYALQVEPTGSLRRVQITQERVQQVQVNAEIINFLTQHYNFILHFQSRNMSNV